MSNKHDDATKMAVVVHDRDRGSAAVQGVRDLRKALRSETRPEAAVVRIEKAVPQLLGGLRQKLEQSGKDVADELERRAGDELKEVERRAEALARAERRLKERVRMLTETDPTVKGKVERMHRHLNELDDTTRELLEGMVELEKGFAPLEEAEKERLLARASAALFCAFSQPGPPRITNAPRERHEGDGGSRRNHRDPESGEGRSKRRHH